MWTFGSETQIYKPRYTTTYTDPQTVHHTNTPSTSLTRNVDYQHAVILLWGWTDEVGILVSSVCTSVICKIYLKRCPFTKRNVIYSSYDLRNQLRIWNIPTSGCDIINNLQPEEEFACSHADSNVESESVWTPCSHKLQTCSKYALGERSKTYYDRKKRGFPNDRISRTVQNSQKTCWKKTSSDRIRKKKKSSLSLKKQNKKFWEAFWNWSIIPSLLYLQKRTLVATA
jgi:hypothetical protein